MPYRPSSARPSGFGAAPRGACIALLALGTSGCGDDPEAALVGCWEQVEWRYERVDGEPPGRWTDGVRSREYPDRQILNHRAEWWDVDRRGRLRVAMPGGERVRGRWRLKGRGHVLTIRYPRTDAFEVYDIKELDDDELVLQYDMGMEARGIARLRFVRSPDQAACGAHASRAPLGGSEGRS